MSDAADLPDDIDALKAALREARATIADRDIALQERDAERDAARAEALAAQAAQKLGASQNATVQPAAVTPTSGVVHVFKLP